MNITGVVRIDLSGYVRDGDLVVGDRAVYELGDAFRADPEHRRFLVDIGAAQRVSMLDERLVDLLVGADHVEVVGSAPDGVENAAYVLRQVSDERIPGPRSAS